MWSFIRAALQSEYRSRIIYVALGVFFGFLYLIVGFWDMLVFAFIVMVGYVLGRRADRRQYVDWRGLADWLTSRWKGFK